MNRHLTQNYRDGWGDRPGGVTLVEIFGRRSMIEENKGGGSGLYSKPPPQSLMLDMKRILFLFLLSVAFSSGPLLHAVDELVRREWTMDGVSREALIHVPISAKTAPSPVLFVFHGHGGTMAAMARRFDCQTLWPEALVVYPQGLPTAGKLTDPDGKKTGWQHGVGTNDDRDLKILRCDAGQPAPGLSGG